MDNRLIGIHIMVNNEAELLPDCLESVKGADELIIVDTGSDDGSDVIALAHGAKVIYAEWTDSFAAARNEALLHASTEWILYVDADERLTGGIEAIRTLIQDTNAEAFTILIENAIGPALEDRLFHRAVRLFRSGRGFTFQGAIHEDIGQSIVDRHGLSSIQDSSLHLLHLGYLPEQMNRKNKIARNEALLKKSLSEQPHHPFYLYHMGITFCQRGQLEAAAEYMGKALLHIPDTASFRPTLVRDLAKIRIERQEIVPAEMLLRKELRTYPDYADLHFALGQTLELQGQLDASLEAFRRAASCRNDRYVTEAGISGYRAFSKMGDIAARLERYELAAQSFHQALQEHRIYHPALMGIAEAFQLLDVPDPEIATLLQTLIQPQTPAQYAALADVLYRIGAFPSWIASIPPNLLENIEFRLQYAMVLIHIGSYAEAEVSLSKHAFHSEKDQEQAAQLRYLCQLQLHGRLQETALTDLPGPLPGPLRELLLQLDQSLLLMILGDCSEDACQLSDLACGLVRQAVSLQCLKAAEQLAACSDECRLIYAKELYRLGRTAEAAELFIAMLQEEQLDEEGMFMLGEIVYDKGHLLQAAELFEGALATRPDHSVARTAASLCYLRLAADSLRRAASQSQNAQLFADDLAKIDSSILLLNRTGWHTVWTGYQRRVRNDATGHLFMHDREE